MARTNYSKPYFQLAQLQNIVAVKIICVACFDSGFPLMTKELPYAEGLCKSITDIGIVASIPSAFLLPDITILEHYEQVCHD